MKTRFLIITGMILFIIGFMTNLSFAESGYVVETRNDIITWFGALQILIILGIAGIVTYLIYRRICK